MVSFPAVPSTHTLTNCQIDKTSQQHKQPGLQYSSYLKCIKSTSFSVPPSSMKKLGLHYLALRLAITFNTLSLALIYNYIVVCNNII